jgi:SPRY domain
MMLGGQAKIGISSRDAFASTVCSGQMRNGLSYSSDGLCCVHGIDLFAGPNFSNGDIIGTLLNMNHKTISFYKNGIRSGMAASNDQDLYENLQPLPGDEYYPCISLSMRGQEVFSIEVLL